MPSNEASSIQKDNENTNTSTKLSCASNNVLPMINQQQQPSNIFNPKKYWLNRSNLSNDNLTNAQINSAQNVEINKISEVCNMIKVEKSQSSETEELQKIVVEKKEEEKKVKLFFFLKGALLKFDFGIFTCNTFRFQVLFFFI